MAFQQTRVIGQPETAGGQQDVLSVFDQTLRLRQITNTHAPDGRQVNVKLLLDVVEDIFGRAVPSVEAISAAGRTETQSHIDSNLDQITDQFGPPLASLIDRICCEIKSKCAGGVTPHAIAMSILSMLSGYPWDAKLVLALSAFAVTYGEFWLVAQNYTSNELAKTVAILKQIPEILGNYSALKLQFDAIKNLIRVMVDISKCVLELSVIPWGDIIIVEDFDALAMSIDHIPVSVYRTIRSISTCASQLIGLTLLGRDYRVSTAEASEISNLAHDLSKMHYHLYTQLCSCRKHIDESKYLKAYQNLLHLFEMVHIDNMRVLKELILQKNGLQPLVDGATKRRVNLDVLKRKNVLLLIADLDILEEELNILQQIYDEARRQSTRDENLYEVVWLPVLDPTLEWTENKQKKFQNLQAAMPWYTVHHPSLIDRAVEKFIKEQWHFSKKPILVVLDPQGRVACPNALHMMWIWRGLAFPFTTSREEALWKEETWRLDLLVDAIDPVILNWISEGRYICLYGGEDIEWIRNFTTTATAVAKAAGISLDMVYVGQSNPKESVRRNNTTIATEKLSHYWQDLTSIWYFWVRLESMWHSKNQLGRTVENDPIMREIMAMLSCDGSEGGWVVFAKGSAEITRAKGGTFLTCLQQFNLWKEQAQKIGFVPALQDHLRQLHSPHHCSQLVLPSGTTGMIPEKVVCSECGRTMERYIMYRCCDQ